MKIFNSIYSFIKNNNPETSIKWSLYFRAWREFGIPYWPYIIGGIVCTVLATSAEGYTITLVKDIIDRGFIEKNMGILYLIGIELVLAYFCKSIFSYAKTYLMSRAGLLAASRLRNNLYTHLLQMSQSYFQRMPTGPIVNAFSGMANAVLSLVTDSVIAIVQNISTLVVMIFLMFWYAPQLTILLLFIVPAIIVSVTVLSRLKRRWIRKSFTNVSDTMNLLNETLLGIKTIQSFVTENTEIKNMEKIQKDSVRIGLKSALISGLQSPLLEIFISLALCCALMVGGHFITAGELTTGDFTAFLLALTAAYKPAKSLSSIGGGIQNGLIGAEGVFGMIDEKSDISDKNNAITLKKEPININLNHINFAYNKHEGNVINDLCLNIPSGKICAFVGPSGGGKSTIFNLLLHFYEPQCGQIKFNGININDYTLASLRNNISLVSQDVFLFNTSIAENIRYGTPNATDAEVKKAAHLANADEFIKAFPDGYDFIVGERGQMLSGGQRQRIAIARALLKDAPVLLLDEATSALDSNSEHLIQEALKTLMKGRTTLVIAHRLSTILDADIICVIENGRIVEKGTDSELYALNGEYTKLRDLQMKKESNR